MRSARNGLFNQSSALQIVDSDVVDAWVTIREIEGRTWMVIARYWPQADHDQKFQLEIREWILTDHGHWWSQRLFLHWRSQWEEEDESSLAPDWRAQLAAVDDASDPDELEADDAGEIRWRLAVAHARHDLAGFLATQRILEVF